MERWLGLARIAIQTASGSGGAEMTIEGLLQFEAVRDFLYSRMRGSVNAEHKPDTSSQDPLAGVLREIAAELRGIRLALGEQPRV